jgi:hypothetical protein
MPEEAYQQAMMMRKVFPRQQPPAGNLRDKLMTAQAPGSEMAEMQVMQETAKGQNVAEAITSVDKMAKGQEALMPKVPNTMGGLG